MFINTNNFEVLLVFRSVFRSVVLSLFICFAVMIMLRVIFFIFDTFANNNKLCNRRISCLSVFV